MKQQKRLLYRLLVAGASLLASYVSTTSSLADYPGTVLGQGADIYYRFSETTPVPDIPTIATNRGSLSSLNGDYQGDLAGRGATGVLSDNTAASFDGSSESVLVPWNAAINTYSNWSVEAWFAPA